MFKLAQFLAQMSVLILPRVNPVLLRMNKTWAEIHQALLSQFSLLAELFNGKLVVKDCDSRFLELVNLDPGE
jgi:hypothetical protein